MTAMSPHPSPNFNMRAANISLAYVVLHYTDMLDAPSALDRLCDPEAEVSAHYVIDRDGSVYHLVDERYRAWHAGRSFWRGVRDMNSASVGIELCNPGHSNGYLPFPPAQISALKKLLREIIARHDLAARTCLLGHSDIAPARKEDPGHLFPWQELAADGLGLWPQVQPADKDGAALSEPEVAALLSTIGYDTDDLYAAVAAFQMRFRPADFSGIADEETVALLRAVARAE